MRNWSCLFFIGCVAAFCGGGCAHYDGQFSDKTEEELDAMERSAEIAAKSFREGQIKSAESTFRVLAADRTVSQPLYNLDCIPCHLLLGQSDEAYAVMRSLRRELEELYDPQMEQKALSSWHGEVNKVFKGEPHETATFYALMSMSCAERGEFEDAWRCVQNGLLHDSDSEHERYRSDYALLLYLGAVYADRLGEVDSAEQCRTRLEAALRLRGAMFDRKRCPDACTEPLFNKIPVNAMIAVWTGTPPKFGRSGEYGDKRTVLRGEECRFDIITVSDKSGRERIVPQRLGDINFQATTRGGREMDNVLKDKADFKDDLHSFKTASRGISGFFFECGNETVATDMGALIAKGGFYATGLIFKIFEGVFFLAFDAVDAHADIRSWKTLPGQLDVVPLYLEPGINEVVVRGYMGGEVVVEKKVAVNAPSNNAIGISHVTMMGNNWTDMRAGEISKLLVKIHATENDTPVMDYPSDNSVYDTTATYAFLAGFSTDAEQVPIRETMIRHGYTQIYRAGDAKAGIGKISADKTIGLLTRNFWLRKVDDKSFLDCRIGVFVKDRVSGKVSLFHAWSRSATKCENIRALTNTEKIKSIRLAAENLMKIPSFRLALGPKTNGVSMRMKQDAAQLDSVPRVKPLSGKAAQLVGTWRSWLEVEEVKKQMGMEDAVDFADYMPVTGEITLELMADGSARATEQEGRTFGHSTGAWKYRHGMLEMELTAENGEKYTMSGIVKWQGVDAFNLQYMVNDWRDMMKMRTVGLGDGITASCQYQDGKMHVVIVRPGEGAKMSERICKINIFRRQ